MLWNVPDFKLDSELLYADLFAMLVSLDCSVNCSKNNLCRFVNRKTQLFQILNSLEPFLQLNYLEMM